MRIPNLVRALLGIMRAAAVLPLLPARAVGKAYVHVAAHVHQLQRRTPYGNPLPRTLHVQLRTQDLKPGRLIIIGDVHGCMDELHQLLHEAVKLADDDNVFFVGDLVNKGPKSVEVIRFFDELAASGRAWGVRGNHDDHILRRWYEWRQHGGELKGKHTWIKDVTPQDANVLQQLPFSITLPELHLLMVHAGAVPGVPPQQQDLDNLVHIRNLVEEGEVTGGPSQPNGPAVGRLVGSKHTERGQAWAARWTGPLHVFFGHDARRKLQLEAAATGLDTGCVYGGQLTAAVLPPAAQLLQRLQAAAAAGQQSSGTDSDSACGSTGGAGSGAGAGTCALVTRELLGCELVSLPATQVHVQVEAKD